MAVSLCGSMSRMSPDFSFRRAAQWPPMRTPVVACGIKREESGFCTGGRVVNGSRL